MLLIEHLQTHFSNTAVSESLHYLQTNKFKARELFASVEEGAINVPVGRIIVDIGTPGVHVGPPRDIF